MDVTKLIIAKTDQLNSDDLIAGDRTVKITRVEEGNKEQPLKVFFEGDGGKPYKPGLSMMRVMVRIWGAESEDWIGHSMTLYNDPNVSFGGTKVGGIRISHMTGLNGEKSFPLTVAKARKSTYTVKPLQKAAPAVDPEEAFKSAKFAADRGTAAFKSWWVSDDGKKMRGWLSEEDTKKLQDACAAADKTDDDDTFPGDR